MAHAVSPGDETAKKAMTRRTGVATRGNSPNACLVAADRGGLHNRQRGHPGTRTAYRNFNLDASGSTGNDAILPRATNE
jgi:hypothetical protein